MEIVQAVTTQETQKLRNRYKNAYRVAWVITIVGFVINLLGVIAMLILPISHETSGTLRAMDKGFAEVLVIFGYVLGLLLLVAGVLVSAQGWILRVHLDNAVNSSPFLRDELRAELLSLR